MNRVAHILTFVVDGQTYALHLSAVECVIHAVEITPLPDSPPCVAGIINVRGKILPVFNLRRRFQMPDREVQLNDHIIIARTTHRRVALLVDSVDGVIEYDDAESFPTETVLCHNDYVEGMIKRPDGLILIHDLNTFLSLDEEHTMESALTSRTALP